MKMKIETKIGKQAKRREFDDTTSIATVFLAPEMDVKL
jgi:hypothetical protein